MINYIISLIPIYLLVVGGKVVGIKGKRNQLNYSCLLFSIFYESVNMNRSSSDLERLWALELDLAYQSVCLFEQDTASLSLLFFICKNKMIITTLVVTVKIKDVLEGLPLSEH